MTDKKTIFSGVKPSGDLHIGNYLGAISQWVEMYEQYNSIFCVVDYHAITVKQDPELLRKRTLDIARVYLAAGIDPKKAVIFQQSHVSAHTELAWIFNCIIKAGELKRMRQFNDKIGIVSREKLEEELVEYLGKIADTKISELKKNAEIAGKKYNVEKFISLNNDKEAIANFLASLSVEIAKSMEATTAGYFKEAQSRSTEILNREDEKFNLATVGLFDYPALMAADIVLYNTDEVPVGEDQKQHVELARDLAKRFNHHYGDALKVPQAVVRKEGARIMGLDDPLKKMGKSESAANYIALNDKPETAKKKIMRAVTDSGSEIIYDKEKKPAIANLLTIYSLLAKKSIKDLEKEYKGKGYGDFKKDLADVVANFLADFQKKYDSYSDADVRKILDDGAKRVRPIAEETLKRVKEKMGII